MISSKENCHLDQFPNVSYFRTVFKHEFMGSLERHFEINFGNILRPRDFYKSKDTFKKNQGFSTVKEPNINICFRKTE